MRCSVFAFALFFASTSAFAGDGKTIHPVVVELFTSQGCSDCPPADRLLAEIAQRRDVVALTLPITYWDMLGWKDTFATEQNTARQKWYARIMNHSGIYTPQIVVDGTVDVVGSQRDKVIAAIDRQAHVDQAAPAIPIAIAAGEDKIEIAIAGNPAGTTANAHIWLMRTRSQARVDVEEGENNGKTLFYVNLVREMKDLGGWNGGPRVIDVPMELRTADRDGLVVLLQNATNGAIIGAAMAQSPDKVDPGDDAE
jgi:hypothetical protein